MKERLMRREFLRASGAFILASACKPLSTETPETEPTPETEGIGDLDFPLLTPDIYLLNGPHYIARGPGVRYALDFSSVQKIPCSPGDKKSIKDAKAVPSKRGTVKIAGGKDKNDRNDPLHSIVEIDIGNGYSLEYVHLDNIVVNVGDVVRREQELGAMSCEVPAPYINSEGRTVIPSTDEIHLHWGVKKDGKPVRIDGLVFRGGWEVKEGQNPGEGIIRRTDEYALPNRTVTPDIRRNIRNSIPYPSMGRPGIIITPSKSP